MGTEMASQASITNTLILFASTHGQTEKIASEIATRFPGSCPTQVVNINDSEKLDLSGFDAVVIAASIHAGHHQRSVIDWVKENRELVDDRSNAFISVSLTAAEDTDEARQTTSTMIEDFKSETGWLPDETHAIAGALQYREYDMFTRLFMRLLMSRENHPTDTSHNFDYTDWDAVRLLGDKLFNRFVAEAAGRVPQSA